MYVIYLIYGIAGWVALAVFLAFWAGMAWGRCVDRREKPTASMDSHEKKP